MIGKVVNYRYEILEKAGDGNFFSVYKARDKVLNRLVAIKVLNPSASENKDFAERIVAETQSVQDLAHPGIARVFECDSHEGTYFTAEEYVRGINLKDRIRRTAPFTISYAVDIAIVVAEALNYAHKRGVVHGDVRPHNVITGAEGEVKLTDFGFYAAVSAFPTLKDNSMLRMIHYTAPEVLKGQIPQPASDVYSLGVVIYEMITGNVPFDGDSAITIATKHLQESPTPPSQINLGIPRLLNDIVMKALAKNPQERYVSVANMLNDLYAVRDTLRTGQASQTEARPTTAEISTPPPLAVEELQDFEDTNLRGTIITLLGVFFVLMAIGVAIAYFWVGNRLTQIGIPDFTGMTFVQAQEMAQEKGLELQEYRSEYNDHYPEGQVYLTAPPPGGTVPKDSPIVKAWISKGRRFIVVPSVIGIKQETAMERIGDARLVPKVKQESSDSVEAGIVISQEPEAGTRIEPPQQVTIVVSTGAAPPASGEEENTDTSGDQPSPIDVGGERLINITVDVPQNGPQTQAVKIMVTDDQGEDQIAYNQVHQAGDTFTEQVRAYGDTIKIKVDIDGKVIWNRTFTRQNR